MQSGVKAYDNGNIIFAYKLAEAGCLQGKSEECNLLGVLYREGKYIPQNYNKAVLYFTKGCDNKNGFSCLYLSDMYGAGQGTVQNTAKRDEFLEKGIMLLKTGCSNNISEDCRGLGLNYLSGWSTSGIPEGLDALSKSCSLGNNKGCYAMGNYYYFKAEDKIKAYDYYEMACLNDDPASCIMVLDMYNADKSKRSMEASDLIARSERLCTTGASELCIHLSEMYRTYSRISRIDHAKSLDYLKYSCDYNNPYGCKLLGDMYHIGMGVERSDTAAKKWYSKACSLGFYSACNSK